jgi:ABC-2 type transport system ATP-binding protein
VQLWDVRGRRAGQLSGGMQRRLELACALVHQPALLLLDEPTAGIDPILRRTIWEELGRLKAAGRTLLVTTQYVAEAEECDQVALIAGGRLVALGAPEELRRLASGGDLVEIETAAPIDPAVIGQHAGIRDVRSTGYRTLVLVADDAATLTPQLDDLVTGAGGRLVSARQVVPSFDDVFEQLVLRERAEAAGAGSRRRSRWRPRASPACSRSSAASSSRSAGGPARSCRSCSGRS